MGIIQIKDFNVCTVYVSDFEESYKFYTDVLGMNKMRGLGDGVLLRANDELTVYLEGGRTPGESAGSDKPCISICFSTEEGIRESYRRLKELGIPMVGEYMDFGPDFHSFRCADPSGNVLEFAGKP